MFNNTEKEKVVKCGECDKYFGYTEVKKHCPFCHIEYREEEKEIKDPSTPFDDAQGKPLGAGKKRAAKTQKKPFKMW